MILSQKTIQEIKDKTGMKFDRAKDFSILAEDIFEKTGRTIGITTLKRLFGTIEDQRDAIGYTMNTIAIYLGYPSWKAYMGQDSFDSEWGYDDETFFIHLLEPGDQLKVQYLDRQVDFKVIDRSDGREIRRVLRVDDDGRHAELSPDAGQLLLQDPASGAAHHVANHQYLHTDTSVPVSGCVRSISANLL